MYELKISVTKVLGSCTAEPPMKPGDFFCVRDGGISIPQGGYVCLYALQSMLPLIPPKEREIAEDREVDWMWRVHHAQCPDPKGRVVFEIDQIGRVGADTGVLPAISRSTQPEEPPASRSASLHDLRVVVEEVNGKCTSGMRPGDSFWLRDGRLYIPAGHHFCLYALQAALPLLPAKQRPLADGDWMKEDYRVICPDPVGNVIMRIETG